MIGEGKGRYGGREGSDRGGRGMQGGRGGKLTPRGCCLHLFLGGGILGPECR